MRAAATPRKPEEFRTGAFMASRRCAVWSNVAKPQFCRWRAVAMKGMRKGTPNLHRGVLKVISPTQFHWDATPW